MKKLISLTTILLFFASSAFAEGKIYKLDANHASVTWVANHLGFSYVSGKFNEAEGEIFYNEKNPEKSSVKATIQIAKLSTGLPKFDTHLKSADFFNLEKFTTAKFISKKITITGINTANIEGNLTLLGVTKSVTLETKLNKVGLNDFSQKETIGFSAKTKIKRSDFGMNYALPHVSDDIELIIEVEAIIEK